MIVSLEELKTYLRVDTDEEDRLLVSLLESAEKVCSDVLRADASALENIPNGKVAVMYAAAYFYEHREEADHKQLMFTLRALLSGEREAGF